MRAWFLGMMGVLWVRAMRGRYGRIGVPLPPQTQRRLVCWFDAALLGEVRLARPGSVELIGSGIAKRFSHGSLPTTPRGICLGTLIVIESGATDLDAVLFHELVHTEQCRAMGQRRFLARYLEEVLRDGYFDDNGLEGTARALTGRFERGETFCVREAI